MEMSLELLFIPSRTMLWGGGTEKVLLKIFSYDTQFSVTQNIRLLANETTEVMLIQYLPSEGLTLHKAQELSSPAFLERYLEVISSVT